jgi:hypothetical protein
MDLKKVLKDNKLNKEAVKVYRKPIQLRDIENRSKNNKNVIEGEYKTNEDINQLIENEKKTMYHKPWNKLNYGQKLNLLYDYIESKQGEYELDEHDITKLKGIVSKACENNKLNRNSDVIYDMDEKKILDIKILDIPGKKIKIVEKKTKSNTKSKSNIERFLKNGLKK